MSTNSDDLTDSISRLALAEDSEATAMTSQHQPLNAPTSAHATMGQLQRVGDDFPGIRENDAFSPGADAVFVDDARRRETPHFDEGSTLHGAPFPVFLSDLSEFYVLVTIPI